MFFLLILLVLAAIFLRGVFRVLIPVLLGLLVLRLALGALLWLLSPHVLVALLIIAALIWLWRRVRDNQLRD